jgi:hypothetical protein
MRHAAAQSRIAEVVDALDRIIDVLGSAGRDRTDVDRIEPLVRQAHHAAVEAVNELRGRRTGTEPGA